MSALASDIENEQRPSLSNSYGYSSSQNPSWIPQQQQQQQQRYPHSFGKIDESSSRQMWNGNQQQQQQRFPSQYSSNNCKRKNNLK